MPDGSDLDFRDVHAFDERRAHLLAIGNGDKSRIYHTTDGGNPGPFRFRIAIQKAFSTRWHSGIPIMGSRSVIRSTGIF